MLLSIARREKTFSDNAAVSTGVVNESSMQTNELIICFFAGPFQLGCGMSSSLTFQPGLGTSQQISDFIFEFELDYNIGLPGSPAYVLGYLVIVNISHYLSVPSSLPFSSPPDHSLFLFFLRSLFFSVHVHAQTHVLRKSPINRRQKFINVTQSNLF